MSVSRLARLVREGRGLPAYLRHTLTAEEAERSTAERMEGRAERFLDVVRRLIWPHPNHPYRRLIEHTGAGIGDLETEARCHGLETLLERLQSEGVRLSRTELRGESAITRPGLTIEPVPHAFTPALSAGGLSGKSSGTTSAGVGANYNWRFLAEEADLEVLLEQQHRFEGAPLAMWMPGPPGLAGIHNLLLHLKARRSVERWFSQTSPPGWSETPLERCALAYLEACSRGAGIKFPTMIHTPYEEASAVAAWLEEAGAGAVLKTYAGSAVRLVDAARSAGRDLRGQVLFTGGEPLTARRREFLENAGLRVHPRFVATECGLIAAACGAARSDAPDSMHVYLDRLAVIASPACSVIDGRTRNGLALTTLSLDTSRILINAELGDHAVIDRRSCECVFGRLGMDLHISWVSSPEKLTAQGMNVSISTVHGIVDDLMAGYGASPEDFQFWVTPGKLTVAVKPSVAIDERLAERILERLRQGEEPAAGLASEIWQQANALTVIRDTPRSTAGHKALPVIPDPRESKHGTV